jgi:hypothetical protein
MKTNSTPSSEKTYPCETCAMRKKAEANPKSLMARLWHWHTVVSWVESIPGTSR